MNPNQDNVEGSTATFAVDLSFSTTIPVSMQTDLSCMPLNLSLLDANGVQLVDEDDGGGSFLN